FTERRREPRTGGFITLDHRIVKLPRDIKGGHGPQYTRIERDEYHTEPNHEYSEALIVSPNCQSGAILYTSYYPPHALMRPAVPFFDLLQRARASDPTL